MKWAYLLLVVGAAMLLGLLYVLFPRPDMSDGVTGFETWKPTPNEISTAVRKIPESQSKERDSLFAKMFQARFRNNRRAVAVKVREGQPLELLCAAVTPRWDMATIAEALYREARICLGRNVNIEIYETYISSQNRLVATCRPNPDGTRLVVSFLPVPITRQRAARATPRGDQRRSMLTYWMLSLPESERRKIAPARPAYMSNWAQGLASPGLTTPQNAPEK